MFFERVTKFFQEYLKIPKDFKDENNLVSDEVAIRCCVNFLVSRKVFTKDEMRIRALKDYGIVLPHKYFR